MAFKNISLSIEAYELLKKARREGESFSKEILRLVRTKKVSDIAGILSEGEAAEWKRGIARVRSEAKIRQWQ